MMECHLQGIEILAIECHVDHVHMVVSVLPTMSVPSIMKHMKGATSKALRQEFHELSAMPSLWTRSYLVSTEELDSETIKEYVESQRKRPEEKKKKRRGIHEQQRTETKKR